MSNSKQTAVLVTGAAGGIGKAIVAACLQLGWFVFANVRSKESWEVLLQALQQKASNVQDNCHPIIYDVTEPAQVSAAFNEIRKSGKVLFALVNNAGVMHDSAISMTSLETFNQQMAINVTAPFQHLQLASRLMSRQKSGRIINLSSVVAIEVSAGQVGYSASKAAILGMTKSAAKELAPVGISVNAIAPGFIDTQLTAAYQDQKRQDVIANIAVGREGQPEDVAALVMHLLSDEAAYITGQTIKIDGMMSLH